MGEGFHWSKLSLLLIIGAALVGSGGALQAQRINKDANSCRDFVQHFYDWYTNLDARNETTHEARTTMDIALRLRPNFFSHDLLRMLKSDSSAQAHADEIVGLDFDPFFNSQDPSSRFESGHASITNGNCRVLVTGIEEDTVRERVEPELTFRSGRWIFTNFHYPDASNPADENLVSILHMLRNNRRKGRR